MANNMYIGIEDNPAFNEFDLVKDGGIPTAEQLNVAYRPNIDNYMPTVAEPTNWLIFDPGDSTNTRPKWASTTSNIENVSGNLYWENGVLSFNSPQSAFPNYYALGNNSSLYENGGPRNLGYAEISNKTTVQINKGIPIGSDFGPWQVYPGTEIWKQGAIEFTIKPTKNNCTLASGMLYGDSVVPGVISSPGSYGSVNLSSGYKSGDPRQIHNFAMNDGLNNADSQTVQVKLTRGPKLETSYPNEWEIKELAQSIYETAEVKSAGRSLTSLEHTYRTFNVDLVNGVLRLSYNIPFGSTKRYFELFGKTNIVDGNWHHIVINKPTKFTIKDGELVYGNNGCIEIWVDGQLENRSYEITTNDPLPVPMMLFNALDNAGIINRFTGSDYDLIAQQNNYEGGIRDFIFRQSLALTPHLIKLNYVYAMLNSEGSKIVKPAESVCTANFINPTVSVNTKKVLKLYWDNLLSDKEKIINGLEFDETYQVYSYSVTHKNLLSPTKTFNLDLSSFNESPKFLSNVKTAIGQQINVTTPGTQLVQSTPGLQIDYTNDARISSFIGDENFITNLLYGGVTLEKNDRILLFNQAKPSNNGVWIFNGFNAALTRPTDIAPAQLQNANIYVNNGKYADKVFMQIEKIKDIKRDTQKWIQVNNETSINADVYPIHTSPWVDNYGNQRFIDVNNDITDNFDIIAFMNYPEQSKDILSSFSVEDDRYIYEEYNKFIESLLLAVNNGKRLYVSSPQLATDLNIVKKITYVPQMLQDSDAQSASISPFESGEPAENYFDTHRNMKYNLGTTIAGLTNKETYIMTDFVTYSPDKINSDYHIKYSYRQFGLQEGDEFYIPGLTTIPETLNLQLPGYLYNQKSTKDLAVFAPEDINIGTVVATLSNTVYNGSSVVNNPYDDYATTLAIIYGSGKIFVNCVENGYAFSRLEYNKAIIQNITAGQNAETTQTAAWNYSTKRLNKKNLYDFSDDANPIGQTTPTSGGGGALIQAQSHCSNGVIRNQTNKNDLQYQSDLYSDYTEEIFSTTEIPVLSMTWLGLEWLRS